MQKGAWQFDAASLIDACVTEELIEEIGFAEVRKLVVKELRDVKRAPRVATVHLIDGELVYLRRIGRGWANGRIRPALMLTYTLYERIIEPLLVFKASEVSEEETVIEEAPILRPVLVDAPKGKLTADHPLPEPVERRLARALRDARTRRKH